MIVQFDLLYAASLILTANLIILTSLVFVWVAHKLAKRFFIR